jgi:hypothetical protein
VVFDLYRNAGTPVSGKPGGAQFDWPGSACTPSTVKLYPELQCRKIAFARWVLSWNPMTGTSPTGVRLVFADDGPSNIQEIVRQLRTNGNTPYDDAFDITAKFQATWNAYQAAGKYVNLGHQTVGNGGNSPLIYGSWVELGLV